MIGISSDHSCIPRYLFNLFSKTFWEPVKQDDSKKREQKNPDGTNRQDFAYIEAIFLLSDAQLFDDSAVSVNIDADQIIQQPTTFTNQHLK